MKVLLQKILGFLCGGYLRAISFLVSILLHISVLSAEDAYRAEIRVVLLVTSEESVLRDSSRATCFAVVCN
jgi:hypothetical protein